MMPKVMGEKVFGLTSEIPNKALIMSSSILIVLKIKL